MTMRRALFILSYSIMHLGPIYVIMGMMAGSYFAVPGWVVVLPVFVIFVPAGLYMLSRRCPSCGNLIYTVEHMKKAPGGLYRVPIHIFRSCPVCGHKLDESQADPITDPGDLPGRGQ